MPLLCHGSCTRASPRWCLVARTAEAAFARWMLTWASLVLMTCVSAQQRLLFTRRGGSGVSLVIACHQGDVRGYRSVAEEEVVASRHYVVSGHLVDAK